MATAAKTHVVEDAGKSSHAKAATPFPGALAGLLEFPASSAGNTDINATVSLPQPCIAPVVFVFGAPNVGWFAATGS